MPSQGLLNQPPAPSKGSSPEPRRSNRPLRQIKSSNNATDMLSRGHASDSGVGGSPPARKRSSDASVGGKSSNGHDSARPPRAKVKQRCTVTCCLTLCVVHPRCCSAFFVLQSSCAKEKRRSNATDGDALLERQKQYLHRLAAQKKQVLEQQQREKQQQSEAHQKV